MSAMDGPASGPEFKGDQSSGGRKGGVISSNPGIDPSAIDGMIQNASQPPTGPDRAAQRNAPQGSQTSVFEEPGPGFAQGPVPFHEDRLIPDDPDARIRALYRMFPNEDLRRLLEYRDRG